MIEIRVPTLGESVTEATVAQWFKQPGEQVAKDEPLCELETDKVAVEVPAPASGKLAEILAESGVALEVGGLLGRIDESAVGQTSATPGATDGVQVQAKPKAAPPPDAGLQAELAKVAKPAPQRAAASAAAAPAAAAAVAEVAPLSPAVRRMVEEHRLDPAQIPASGKDGRLLKEDVQAYLERKPAAAPAPQPAPAAAPQPQPAARPKPAPAPGGPRPFAEREEVVRMTRLRQRIAERLKAAQETAAMLTTFNEVDMSAAMKARSDYREVFEKKHGVRLGFMSFFVRASVLALKEFPAVNAEIEGENLIYKNYYNIGVAVSTPSGLVVPVLRDADAMSFAEVEKTINDFGRRARDGKLGIDEMLHGSFTISNGGVFGSLMSTPILNPPQAGILGMHKIQERPVGVDGRIELRPMMYLALSYDHRIIDGREAVSFLVRLKELIEQPERLLLDV
jgi:2-oxoglutarate dehydrogenase E2 component (dihydrolipoamide succinyltransferase)